MNYETRDNIKAVFLFCMCMVLSWAIVESIIWLFNHVRIMP